MKTLAIALAFGDIYTERGTGKLRFPYDSSILRFERLTSELRTNVEILRPVLIVCTAGYTRDQPTKASQSRTVSLAQQLAQYASKGEYLQDGWDAFFEPRCWGTQNEVRNAVTVAEEKGYNKDEPVTVLIASNWWHLWRIRFYAYRHIPKRWTVQYLTTREHFPFREKVLECIKLVRDMLSALCEPRRTK